ncbi:MAG: mechanosensitive ion channel [Candidatus Limnocylindria bacterium]
MQDVIDTFSDTFGAYLPSLVAALAILVIGWLVAAIIARLVQAALHRTHLDDRLAAWITGDDKPAEGRSERWIGRGVFYLLMLFVLVAFFQALGLTIITQPLNQLLVQVFEYAPRVLGAVLILFVAWIVASLLRVVVSRGLRMIRIDERLRAAGTDAGGIPIPQALGDAVFWLTIVVFLPAVIGALALEGLLGPVQGAIDEVLRFLPNVFAAGLILLIGWLVARIAQRITAGVLAGVGVDRVADQAGAGRLLGEQRLSGLLGLLVYALILIPTLIAALDALRLTALTAPAINMLDVILGAVPSIFGTAIVLTLAYVLGRVVAGLVAGLLAGVGFNNILARLGIARGPVPGQRTPSQIVGDLVLVAIMLFASIEALRLLGFVLVADLVAEFLVFASRILVGVVIFGVGLFLANVVAGAIRASAVDQAGLLATAARVAILTLAAAMGLRQMGLAAEIVNLAFGLVLGAIAVAVALAFGLGGRDIAAEQLREWRQRVAAPERPGRTGPGRPGPGPDAAP